MLIKRRKILVCFLILLCISLVACKNSENTLKPNDDQNNDKSFAISDLVIGFYEGTTNQSGQNVLTSLNLKEGGIYEFYISTLGLVDQGKYEMIDENSIKFSSQETTSEFIGKYNNGNIKSEFTINNNKTEYSFDQVGSPDDFYKVFLGDYIATNASNEVVVLSLRNNKMFEISSTDINGNFDIINGELILKGSNNELLSKGKFDVKEKVIDISLNINNVENNYTFFMNSEDNNISYYGYSAIGMSGNTPVTLIIKPAKRFEVITSKPRGIGVYEIGKSVDGGYEITLKYTDPASRPDGTDFIMNGVISSEDITNPNTTIIIEQIEYMVDMGEGSLSTMNLGRVEFSTKPFEEAVAEKPEVVQTPVETTEPKDTSGSNNQTETNEPKKPEETKPAEQNNENNDTKDTTLNIVGQYATTVMGTTEVLLDIKEDGTYELGTGETGKYEVTSDGKITFTPDTEGRNPYETVYDTTLNGFTINFAIIKGTPVNDYVFIKK